MPQNYLAASKRYTKVVSSRQQNRRQTRGIIKDPLNMPRSHLNQCHSFLLSIKSLLQLLEGHELTLWLANMSSTYLTSPSTHLIYPRCFFSEEHRWPGVPDVIGQLKVFSKDSRSPSSLSSIWTTCRLGLLISDVSTLVTAPSHIDGFSAPPPPTSNLPM